MSFKQLCQIWTCKINSTKCPFWMSKNFRKYPKLNQEKFRTFEFKYFTNSRTFKTLNFCFQIHGLSSFVRIYCQLNLYFKHAACFIRVLQKKTAYFIDLYFTHAGFIKVLQKKTAYFIDLYFIHAGFIKVLQKKTAYFIDLYFTHAGFIQK
jgi:hypothetical protein